MEHFDHIIVGLGSVGSAVSLELARRGRRVLGFDAYSPPHTRGSHHGESRSVRKAYLEGTVYVPMALRAWELWRRLEKDCGKQLLLKSGNLTIGPADAPAVTGFFSSARKYDLEHQELSSDQVIKKWPQLKVPKGYIAGLEVEAGIVLAEKSIEVMLQQAARAGARLHPNERVNSWWETEGHVEAVTERGRYRAESILFAADTGNLALLPQLSSHLRCKRVPVGWVTPLKESAFQLGRFPVNFWQVPMQDNGNEPNYAEFYSLPCMQPGSQVKVAPHNNLMDMGENLSEELQPTELEHLRLLIRRYLPSLAEGKIVHSTCQYTLTDDGHFFLGKVPGKGQTYCAVLGGHGFKFSPVLGEIFADLMTDAPTGFNLDLFSLHRLPT